MGKEYFKLLANYNKESNNLMNKIITTLTEEQWNKQFSGYFKSIREICRHIYFWDYNWLKRYRLIRDFNIFTDDIFKKDVFMSIDIMNINDYSKMRNDLDNIFMNKDAYLRMRNDLDKIIIKFTNELMEADLKSILKFSTTNGISYEKRLDGLLMHFFNHQTHHRGMISLYLEMLGIENDFSNLMQFVK
jgi:uncharacterized damage-inducible protein DinB